MQEPLNLPATNDRVTLFTALMPQLRELLREERDQIAALANVAAALRQTFGWHWIGFYRVMGAELVLGPFQGPIACTRIGFGKGVCGAAWQEERTIIVPDVTQFPGHIACSAEARSEIVVPIRDSDG
ncbi:MAG: GAF domain-containing protein, partial [Flavobacteriales bacterium]